MCDWSSHESNTIKLDKRSSYNDHFNREIQRFLSLYIRKPTFRRGRLLIQTDKRMKSVRKHSSTRIASPHFNKLYFGGKWNNFKVQNQSPRKFPNLQDSKLKSRCKQNPEGSIHQTQPQEIMSPPSLSRMKK